MRVITVVARPDSYRNILYLLLGLPLGTLWFSVLVSGVSVAVSLLVVALLGIPMLWGLWYVTRSLANVERRVAHALLHLELPPAPMHAPHRGNVWLRLRTMTRDRDRWRELGFLLLRFPMGIATFTATVAVLATPVLVALAPIEARRDEHPFGDWALSSTMEQVASSPWSWFLVPLGAMMLLGSLHLVNLMARVSARSTASWLGRDQRAGK